MKKKILLTLILSAVFFCFFPLFSSKLNADVIPPNTHWYDKCVKIVNTDKYPEIYLIVFVTSPLFIGHEAYIYKKDSCLTAGSRPHKSNKIKILAAKKSYIDRLGLDNLQVRKVKVKISDKSEYYTEEIADENVYVADENIDPSGDFIDNENHLLKVYTEYSIAGYSRGKLYVYKSKEIINYNDNTPQRVVTFSNPFNQQKIIQELKVESTPSLKKTLTANPSPEISQKNSNPIAISSKSQTSKPVKKGFWQSLICLLKRLFGKSCQ